MTTEEATAAAVIRTLATANGVSVADMAREVGISRTAFYDRLAGNSAFLFREIVALARYFEVELNRFTADPRTRLSGVSGSVSDSVWIRSLRLAA